MKTTDASLVVHVYGWDLLRGLCAFAVAIYHLLHWTEIANLSAIGTYAVYIFFILSGASLTHTYKSDWTAGVFKYPRFLIIRYARLAPLYLVLLPIWLTIKPYHHEISLLFAIDALKNTTLLFGFYYPTWHSWLIGGWSIGVEVVFYLFIPVFFRIINLPPKKIFVAASALVFFHFGWIQLTMMPSPLSADTHQNNAAIYHHPQAFALYFLAGCLIGNQSAPLTFARGKIVPFATILGGFALLVAFTPDVGGHELIGWRGALFPCLCMGMVFAAGRIDLQGASQRMATVLGSITYGLYLIHPIIYFAIAWHFMPQLSVQPADVGTIEKWILIALVLITSIILSIVSDQALESPIRKRVKTWLTSKK